MDRPLRPAIFFDRDGVLNRDVGYPHRPNQIEWSPGVFEAVRRANQAGWLVFVVTNQSGVARGLYDEAAVEQLHAWMDGEFAAHGARIDAWSYCPHHQQSLRSGTSRAKTYIPPPPTRGSSAR